MHEESALDRARALKEQFNQAAHNQQQSKQAEQSKTGAQQVSQMLKDDKPSPFPKPPSPQRDIPDQQKYNSNLQKETAAEQQKIENARKAQEAFQSRQQQDKDRDQERDRDR